MRPTRGHDEELGPSASLVSEGLVAPADVVAVEVGATCHASSTALRGERARRPPAARVRRLHRDRACLRGQRELRDLREGQPRRRRPALQSAPGRAGRRVRSRSSVFRKLSAPARRSSRGPAACTPPGSSTHRGSSWRPRGRGTAQCAGQAGRRGRPVRGAAAARPAAPRLRSGQLRGDRPTKAAVAGIALDAAVSAPTDLAVEAAERVGMSLVGFLRGDTFNIYAGRERIQIG